MTPGLPSISHLQTFSVSREFFYVSLAIQALLLLVVLALLIHSLTRTCAQIRDPEYAEGKIIQDVHHAQGGQQGSNLEEDSDEQDETDENKRKQRKFVKIERKILSGMAFFIIGVIAINSFTARIAQAVCLAVAVVVFVVFNLTWVPSKWAKLLFTIPLVACYISCFIEKWELGKV